MPRVRALGLLSSSLPPGKLNAITDVAGVAVGQFTLIQGEGPCQPGHGPLRTGVTLVVPHTGNLYAEKVPAAVHTINGFGKVCGFEQVRTLGSLETPIALTGTLNVPRVADALISLAIEANRLLAQGFPGSDYPEYASINPVVGETNDGYLSDLQARPIGEAEVRAALTQASTGAVAEGSVGAGTGTTCYGWKGGIGTASRVLPEASGGFIVGVLVQSNFGSPEELVIAGLPVGHYLKPPHTPHSAPPGSIMIIIATDAPLDSRQLARLAQRASFGLARTGSTCHAGSGDFVIAFSTAYRLFDPPAGLLTQRTVVADEPHIITQLGLGVIEATEEAIYNSLFMAHTMSGRDGHIRHALPAEAVVRLAQRFGN